MELEEVGEAVSGCCCVGDSMAELPWGGKEGDLRCGSGRCKPENHSEVRRYEASYGHIAV